MHPFIKVTYLLVIMLQGKLPKIIRCNSKKELISDLVFILAMKVLKASKNEKMIKFVMIHCQVLNILRLD
jgi:hypothetical protein